MRPTQHPTNNTILRPPAGATHEECVPLAITKGTDSNGRAWVQSYWQPNEAERKAIAEGALIQLSAWGTTHPPLWVAVDGVAVD